MVPNTVHMPSVMSILFSCHVENSSFFHFIILITDRQGKFGYFLSQFFQRPSPYTPRHHTVFLAEQFVKQASFVKRKFLKLSAENIIHRFQTFWVINVILKVFCFYINYTPVYNFLKNKDANTRSLLYTSNFALV